MPYRYLLLLLLALPISLRAQRHPKGKRLITGILRDSTHDHISGAILIGDSLYRAQQEIYRQMHALQRAETLGTPAQVDALEPAWEQWRMQSERLSRLRRDSAYQAYTDLKTGRFRFWARPTDTIYITAVHHRPQRYRVADLPHHGRDLTLVLRAEKCVPYVACADTTGREYAFIGRKLNLEPTPSPYYCEEPGIFWMPFYEAYTATYQVIQPLAGKYPGDTITFQALDHYGWPPFRPYAQVLLFVKEHCGKLFYQRSFYPVYRTTDGRWAVPYWSWDYQNPELLPPIKAHPIAFATPVTANVSRADSAYIARTYPAPYYRIDNGQAVAVYGHYVEEIMENKQRLVPRIRAYNRKLDAERKRLFPQPPPRKP